MLSATRLAVVSDFHFGRPGTRHSCAVAHADFVAAAQTLAESHDLAVINGDLYDLERGASPSQARELGIVGPAHAETVAAVSGPPWVWTRGNHDRVLEPLGRASAHVDVELPCGAIRVEHGDRFNSWLKRRVAFTSFVTWVNGRVETIPTLRSVSRLMYAADRLLSGSANGEREPVVVSAADWLASETRYAGLVIGHTHVPLLLPLADGRLLMNPGGSTDQVHALSIDGEAGTARLLAWTGSRFEETGCATL